MAIHAIAPAESVRTSKSDGTGSAIREWAARYRRRHADIGTGDGKYAIDLARRASDTAVVAIDANLDHLRGARRRDPANLRFVTANALAWPLESLPRVDAVTINFPYGSLLRGLVERDPALLERLDALLAPGGSIEARVNATALIAGGLDPSRAPAAIASALRQVAGVRVSMRPVDRDELCAFPSSWARRLGFGRDTDAWLIEGRRQP